MSSAHGESDVIIERSLAISGKEIAKESRGEVVGSTVRELSQRVFIWEKVDGVVVRTVEESVQQQME